MDAQADMLCEDGANSRDDYRERGLATPVGDITLRIPKPRAGTYFPEGIIERYSRSDRAVATARSAHEYLSIKPSGKYVPARRLGMHSTMPSTGGQPALAVAVARGGPVLAGHVGLRVHDLVHHGLQERVRQLPHVEEPVAVGEKLL